MATEEFRRSVIALVGASNVPKDLRAELRRALQDFESLIGGRYLSSHREAGAISDDFRQRFLTPGEDFWSGVSQALGKLGKYEEMDGTPLNFPRYEALRNLVRIFVLGGGPLPTKSLDEKAEAQEKISDTLADVAEAMEADSFFASLTVEDLASISPEGRQKAEALGRLRGELFHLRRKYREADKNEIPTDLLGLLEALESYYVHDLASSEPLYSSLQSLSIHGQTSSAAARSAYRRHQEPETVSRHWWAKSPNMGGVLIGDFEALPPVVTHRSQGGGDRLEADRRKVLARELRDWFLHRCGCSRLPRKVLPQICLIAGVSVKAFERL